MHKSDNPIRINDEFRRHPAQFKQVDFLIVFVSDLRIRVRAADKWQLVITPIIFKSLSAVLPYRNDFYVSLLKFSVCGAELLQLPAAEWSGKTPQQCQDNVLTLKKR